MTTDISSRTFDQVPERFELPDGIYTGIIRRASLDGDTSQTGEERDFVELTLIAEEVVEVFEEDPDTHPDAYNINMAFPVRDKLWLHTDGAMAVTADFFRGRLGFETKGVAIPDLVEMAQGQPIKFEVNHNEGKNGRRYTNVKRYMKVS